MRRHAFAIFRVLFSALFLFSVDQAAGWKQESPADADLKRNLAELVATPAVSGYESQLGEKIRARIATLHPIVDNLGDITVTMGSGAPRRFASLSSATFMLP